MRKLLMYQVDAFTTQVFGGNPAAVCPLDAWLDDALLQAIAAENNLSETAFFVREGDGYRLRWFTPTTEVDLCGHATLAAAFVLFEHIDSRLREVTFASKGGQLTVRREGERLCMDFPAMSPQPCTPPPALIEAVGSYPALVLETRDYLLVYRDAQEVASLQPDMSLLASLKRNVIVSAPHDEVDFVSRFFAPWAGIPEDPVTGSAHCTLVPYWSKRLGKSTLHARQISQRGGELFCELRGERVLMAGAAVLYLEGHIQLAALSPSK